MKRNNTKKRWLATAIASAITFGTVIAGTMPTVHADETSIKSKTSHEVVDDSSSRFFSTPDGVIFEFYEIYDVEDGQRLESWMRGREFSKGIYAKVYESENEPFYVQKYETLDTWDNDGTFTFNGEEYQYHLAPASMLRLEHRTLLEDLILHKRSTTPQALAYFDYSKDGRLLVNDIVHLNHRLAATPMSSITNCDPVMYDQMSKDTFYGIIDHALSVGDKELYVYYGDEVPQSATTTTTTATTTTTVTTTSTEATGITWNTGIAKDFTGEDVTWYEVKKTVNDGTVEYEAPEITLNDDDTYSINTDKTCVIEGKERIESLLEIPKKLGVDDSEFKLVATTRPIRYSWMATDLSFKAFNDGVCQVCKVEDLDKFELIFGNGVEFGDGRTLIDTSRKDIYSIMWCPGEWVDYKPFSYESETRLEVEKDGKTYLVDYVLGYSSPFVFDMWINDTCYCLIPTDEARYCIGSGLIEPKAVLKE